MERNLMIAFDDVKLDGFLLINCIYGTVEIGWNEYLNKRSKKVS